MKFHCSRVVVVFLVDTAGQNQSLQGDPENLTQKKTGHRNRIDVQCNQQRFVQEWELFFPYPYAPCMVYLATFMGDF